MKKKLFFSVCLSLPLALFPLSAPAEEGSPLLSVDDLIALEDSYEAVSYTHLTLPTNSLV